MSLFNTLRVGASGLGTSSLGLAVIGDNIANINTIGYKRNQATFADAMPQAIATLGGQAQLGSGARSGSMATAWGQGILDGSGVGTHMAITGGGFFQVSDGENNFYTRDGSFGVDADGFLTSGSGLKVRGFNAVNGDLSAVMSDIKLDQTVVPGSASSLIDMRANLSADAEEGTTLAALRANGMDGSGAVEMSELSGSNSVYTSSVTIYDSLGRAQDVVMAFEKTDAANNEWTYSMLVDGGAAEVGGVAGVEGSALEIGSGTISFDSDGNLSSVTPSAAAPAWRFTGALDTDLELDFGQNPDGIGSLTQEGGSSTTYSVGHDGFGVGELTTTRTDPNGQIFGIYTNGEERLMAQVGLATFDAASGLQRAGGNLFQATQASGDPALGVAGSGGRGDIASYALERSNVDLEDEFVGMIQAQRSYQANSSVVRTANDTLQSLVNLV